MGGPRRKGLVTVVALVERAGDGGGNYPDETKMWLAHWFGSDWPAYAPGQGASRRPRRDDSLSRLIPAPAPGGERDDCLGKFSGGRECEDKGDKVLFVSANTLEYG